MQSYTSDSFREKTKNNGNRKSPTASHPRRVIADMLERERPKETEVMETVNWGQVAEEAEHLVRLCGAAYTVKTFQELIGMGKRECPSLKQALMEGLVAAHFPKD